VCGIQHIPARAILNSLYVATQIEVLARAGEQNRVYVGVMRQICPDILQLDMEPMIDSIAVPTKNLIPMAKVENRGMMRSNDRDLDTAPVPPWLAL
jgi:hypothetical protein